MNKQASSGWLLLAATVLVAGCSQDRDRQAIELLTRDFNHAVARNDSKAIRGLCTSDADLSALEKRPPKRLPFDERTALTLTIKSIDLHGFRSAEVEAVQSDASPMMGTSRQWTCHFGLKRSWKGWRIASYRETPEVVTSTPRG